VPQIEVTFDIDANGILDVKAKDRATGKEQQVRITASSMLSKDAVDQMVRDAAEHADEDKQRREEVETRNQAEALTFQAERTLKDLGDKVSSEDKIEVENQVSSLREALKGSDLDAVRAGMTALAETLNRVSTAAYQAASSEAGPTNGADGEGSDGDGVAGDDGGAAEGAPEGGPRAKRRSRASSRRSSLLVPARSARLLTDAPHASSRQGIPDRCQP
jgi:molecular chaperone DnaK